MNTKNRLIFKLEGPAQNANHLELSVFVEKTRQFLGFLRASAENSKEKDTTFHVVNVSHSSPLTLECVPDHPQSLLAGEIVNRVMEDVEQNLRMVRENAAHYLCHTILSAMERLAKTDHKKITHAEIQVSTSSSEIPFVCLLDDPFRKHLTEARNKDDIDFSTVDGKLEQINIHGTNVFKIYSLLPQMKPVECKFSQDMLEKVHLAFGRYVSVSGECRYRPHEPFPHTVRVQELEVLPRTEDLPMLSDLQGIAPNATGGLSPEDFVRKLRDEWDEK